MTRKYSRRETWKFAAMLRLQNFAGTNRVGRHRHRAANFRRGKAGRQLQRLRKQTIAKQHGDFIAPIGRERELAAADFRLVHHVVMHQRGQMHHLDDDRRRDVRVGGLADAHAAASATSVGRKCLPLPFSAYLA